MFSRASVAGARHRDAALLLAALVLVACDRKASPPNTYTFEAFLGGAGDAPGRFRRPTGLSFAPDGSLYVADSGNHRVQVLSRRGEFIRQWGGRGKDPGRFENPVDVAVARDGSVYVSDFDLDCVQKFAPDASFILAWGRSGQADCEFDGPSGLGIGPDGRVYVADFYNHRIQVFDGSGAHVRTLGNEGHGICELYYPTDVELRADGVLLVADAYNQRIQALTPVGTAVADQYDIGKNLVGSRALEVPTGVSVDRHGRMHIADSGNKRAVLLDRAGAFLTEWSLTEDANPEIYSPTRVVIVEQNVYYVDTSNDRIAVLRVD